MIVVVVVVLFAVTVAGFVAIGRMSPGKGVSMRGEPVSATDLAQPDVEINTQSERTRRTPILIVVGFIALLWLLFVAATSLQWPTQ